MWTEWIAKRRGQSNVSHTRSWLHKKCYVAQRENLPAELIGEEVAGR